MTRSEIARHLSRELALPPRQARGVVDLLFGTEAGEGIIADALDRGERVVFSGFGTLAVRRRPARLITDPVTGRTRRSPPGRAVVFRPGARLRERIR